MTDGKEEDGRARASVCYDQEGGGGEGVLVKLGWCMGAGVLEADGDRGEVQVTVAVAVGLELGM